MNAALLRPLRHWSGLAACIGLAGLVVLRGNLGPGSMGALLAIGGIAALLRAPRLSPEERTLLLVLALLPAYTLLNLLLTGWNANFLPVPMRLVGAWLAAVGLARWGFDWRWLHFGALIGCFAAGGHAAWEVHWQGADRATGSMNEIPFGNLSLLLAGYVVAGLLCRPDGRPASRSWIALGALAAAAGGYASWASGARGGWVALPVLAWLLWRACVAPRTPRQTPRRLPYVLLALVALATLALVLGNARTRGEWHNVVQVLQASPAEMVQLQLGSLATRFHLYHLGLQAFAQHPLLGIGIAGLPAWLAEQIALGHAHPAVARYTHLHNAFIDIAARGGLPGLAVMITTWYGLGRFFNQGWHRAVTPLMRYHATLGLLVTHGMFLFALSNVLLPANVGTNALMLLLALPAGGLLACTTGKETLR